MQIVSCTPAHYPELASLYTCLNPIFPVTGEELAERDRRRDPKFKFHRWVATHQEHVLGAGLYSQSVWFAHPQKFTLWFGVRPEHQGAGIGTALYDTVMVGLQPFDPLALRCLAGEDHPESLRFLTKRGFREVIRDVPSELDVRTFDLAKFAGQEEPLRQQGIEIKTIADLAGDPLRDQKLYDLDWEMSMDVPGDLAAGMTRRGLEKYVEYAIAGPDALPEGFFVAVKGDEYVGLSHVLLQDPGVSLYQGLTGVKPPYRHLGLGLALKLRCIAFAKASGYAFIRAENDSKNLPMLAMNQRLGYVRKPDTITFEKKIRE